MTREEAIELLDDVIGFVEDNQGRDYDTAFRMAIEALKGADGDLIRRKDAIRWVKTECNPYGKPTLDFESGKKVIEHLEQMPSADRPTGECKDCTHWDKLNYEAPRQGWCNQFEEWTDADEYCSRCARMRGEEE